MDNITTQKKSKIAPFSYLEELKMFLDGKIDEVSEKLAKFLKENEATMKELDKLQDDLKNNKISFKTYQRKTERL